MLRWLNNDILNSIPKWTKWILAIFIILAVFRNYIANDIPLYAKIDGHTYFPIIQKDMQMIGIGDAYTRYKQAKNTNNGFYKIYPIIPYHANSLDKDNIHFATPFGKQNIKSWRYRHFLGTDQLGRDILSRIIHGSMTAVKVAIFSSLIALIIGLFMGLIAGYYQDDKIRMNWLEITVWLLGILLILYFGLYHRRYILLSGGWWQWLLSLAYIIMGGWMLRYTSNKWLSSISSKKHNFPVDLFIMRIVEAYKSIPLLLLIFVVLALFDKPSLIHVIWIIGLTRWTTITRYVRAEVLHIQKQSYISAAIATGLPDRKVIWNHILPNAISPIVVTIAFSMSSAILLESTLSFLGIGIPTETVSWGGIIQSARNATDAWWVALFPGIAIFLLVLVFNKIAESVNK